MSNWAGQERRRQERRRGDARNRRDGAAVGRRGPWGDLHGPLRILVLLLIALVLVLLYQQTEFFVSRVFGVLLLFVFAAIVAMLLNPLVDAVVALEGMQHHRGMAVLTVNCLILAALISVGALLAPSLAQQATALGAETPQLVSKVNDALLGAQRALNQRGIPVHIGVPTGLESFVAPALGSALQVVSATIGAVIDILLIAVIAIYLQMQGRGMIATLRQLFPGQQALFDFTLLTAGSTLAGYVRGQVVLAAVMAVYTGVGLSLIGVHFALVIAFITFLLELVPLVGAPVAMVLAVLAAMLQGPNTLLITLVFTLLGHIGFAYTIGLKLIGDATRVHPLVAMAALLLGSQVGGVLGALFAIPLAGIVNVFLGALLRSRRGGEAFSLPDGEPSGMGLDHLPSLGGEIAQMAEDERLVDDPVPHIEPQRRPPRKRSAAKG
ncbi:MAG TPA: AI-2E family transporter [Candidatus Dormibacteraeota bacterium]|nr:AI-2E family transporter [Candidatus Dormibacteraeota bacterium]